MIHPPKKAEQADRPPETCFIAAQLRGGLCRRGSATVFTRQSMPSEPPLLPMIDVVLSKEAASPPHIFGMLYDNWTANLDEEGVTVFLRGYEKRRPNNERKRIYFSADHTGPNRSHDTLTR